MAKIKLNTPVRIDGTNFDAGVYDESEIPAGNIESIITSGWARRVNPKSKDEDEDEQAAPKLEDEDEDEQAALPKSDAPQPKKSKATKPKAS